mgnify:FL=1
MFNNGYNAFYPYGGMPYKAGLFSSLKGKFNWSSLLNNTQKTLNIINQAIPVFYQVKPIWNNTKTVFKIMGAIKDDDSNTTRVVNNNANNANNINNTSNTSTSNLNNSNNTPNFFL